MKRPGILNGLHATAFFASCLLLPACWNDDDRDVPQMDGAMPLMMITGKSDNDNTIDRQDKKFLECAAEINMEEILLGQLAQQKGILPETREFGVMLEQDHKKSMEELKALAARKSIVLPAASDKAMNMHQKLSNESEIEFDEAFAEKMIDGHEDAIDLFEDAAEDTEDPDIRAWADQSLPALRKHLEHARYCLKLAEEREDNYTSKY